MFPNHVEQCLQRLWEAGFQAYPVGGCVRDTLLGRTPGDWDVTTSALPEQVISLFERTVPTGINHGTVTVVFECGVIEVTTFRREGGYTDSRHPDSVSFDVGLEEDLARRDFTVNAMAFAPDRSVIDLFDGEKDLKNRILKSVGDANTRFLEDALRILRGIRFAAQLNFSVEEKTAQAMKQQAEGLKRISAERIVHELEKTLLSANPGFAEGFFRLGAMERFGNPVREADWKKLSACPEDLLCRWQVLCELTGLDIMTLPVSRAVRRAVLHPLDGKEKELALSGGELQELGLRGEAIGRAQKLLVAHVVEHPEENSREKLKDILRTKGLLTIYSEGKEGK